MSRYIQRPDAVAASWHIRGEYDYCDFEVDTTQAGMPKSFGIQQRRVVESLVYRFPVTGNVDWARRLKGAIFWQFPIVDGRRIHSLPQLEE